MGLPCPQPRRLGKQRGPLAHALCPGASGTLAQIRPPAKSPKDRPQRSATERPPMVIARRPWSAPQSAPVR